MVATRFETAFTERALLAGKRAFGITVQIERADGSVTEPFTARRDLQMSDRVGQSFREEQRAIHRRYIIPMCVVEPRTGDRILENSEYYELSPPNESTPAVEVYIDGKEWVVHTKRVFDVEKTVRGYRGEA